MIIQKSNSEKPTLYLVPTPIGNMGDITFRALETLKNVDLILCEDTRVTLELLNYFGIKKKVLRCDEHTEYNKIHLILNILKSNQNIALVSDRGTPLISDPGFNVVSALTKEDFNIVALPGATSFTPALISSGLPTKPFIFYGFLSNKKKKRVKELEELKYLKMSLIFYESPYRINETINDLYEVFGNRKVAICREITKKYEEIIRGTVLEIKNNISNLKGEIVIVVEGNISLEDYSNITIKEHVDLYIKDGVAKIEAIKRVSKERKIPKSIVYDEICVRK